MKELGRIRKACTYSCDGLLAAWRDAGAFRTEIILTPPLTGAAFYVAADRTELALLLGSWLFILVVELLNTGIEAAVDLAAQGRIDPNAKKAKDTASAAVLVACIICAVMWICVGLK